jgi:hypothetical protein
MFGLGCQCTFLIALSPWGWGLVPLAVITGRRALLRKQWPPATWAFLLWPLMMSVAIIAWGQTHWHDFKDPESSNATTGLDLLMVLYLAGALAGIYFNRESRAATTTVLSLGSLQFLGCAFVAGMAVTGTWL